MSELCKGDPAQTQGYGATLPVKGQSRARVRQMTHFRKVRILNTAQITGTRGRCVGLRRRIWSRKCARKRYSQTRRLNLTSAHTVGCVSTATLILLPSRFSEVRVCVAPYWQPQTIHALCVWCRCLYLNVAAGCAAPSFGMRATGELTGVCPCACRAKVLLLSHRLVAFLRSHSHTNAFCRLLCAGRVSSSAV